MATIIRLLVLCAFVSLAFATRSNICLAYNNTLVYKPLQLYPSDCPANATNCMAAVYKYSATQFKSNGPSTLMPKQRESLAYMTQDESDNFDIVVITATSYKNNVIKTIFGMDGAAPGVNTLIRDDPYEDKWYWDPVSNSGNASWILQPGFTDGVVLGHIKVVDNFCFRVEFLPNWQGAISTVSFLSGTVAKPVRVISKPLVGNSVSSTFFEFCEYPKVMISKTDASCGNPGTATATSLSGTGTPTFVWTDASGNVVGTTSQVNNLSAGTYTVTITVAGCDAKRNVTINSVGQPIIGSVTVVDQTRTKQGSITLTASGGTPPYTITWKDSTGTVINTNTYTVSVPAGSYSVVVTDGCYTITLSTTVNGPGSCPAGSYVDGDNCNVCLAGTYSTSPNSNQCTVCPPGSWNNVNNATSCNQCAANTVTDGGSTMCANCPSNTYSAAGSAVCTACAPGTSRPDGATSCTNCPAGTFRCDQNAACAPCAAGSFSNSGASTCEPCDPGTFSASTGATMCSTCAANSYAASGSSSCNSCPSAQPKAPIGSSSIAACMVGPSMQSARLF